MATRHRRGNLYIYWALALLGAAIFFYLGVFGWIWSHTFSPASHIASGFASWINTVISNRNVSWELQSQNLNLKKELEKLLLDNARLSIVEEENKKLRSLTQFSSSFDTLKYVVARVVGKSHDFSSILIINKGSSDGIIPDLAVVSPEGIMVGKVMEVDKYRSWVLLATDAKSVIASIIMGQEPVNALVAGKYGVSLSVDWIPQTGIVGVRDLVLTSGLEENIPRGLLIGSLVQLESVPAELFRYGAVESPILYDGLSIVSVILPPKN
ncbi:MAG: rod shape-determining protein MreC [Parcubacteria group bacterium Gr01-1014_18]|nr:MAG: rod shape-determining protein MreC [Parcubacteria group bacterium Greene0416_36]TSC81521.1 MAG: rod shape-determining protein MreC [Parcubacteria group bacterium Gr01-1014_18]TSC99668.1 MAG: rod shape-determining protein MreC [Parcubacteria group bacterium Greene1014_20]TSD07119.1 MAG: rod shape-determining protein MreC [Parcubacteria group bacterium Greene0714_2]